MNVIYSHESSLTIQKVIAQQSSLHPWNRNCVQQRAMHPRTLREACGRWPSKDEPRKGIANNLAPSHEDDALRCALESQCSEQTVKARLCTPETRHCPPLHTACHDASDGRTCPPILARSRRSRGSIRGQGQARGGESGPARRGGVAAPPRRAFRSLREEKADHVTDHLDGDVLTVVS